MTPQNRRRRYPLVNPSHQYRFLALVLIYATIVAAVMAGALFVPDVVQMQDENLRMEIRALAAEKVLTLHSRLWPAVIALICVIGLHSFRVFHRFIGPVHRFERAFDRIRSGDLGFRVELREKDYLKSEQDRLNGMLSMLNDKLGAIQASTAGALRCLEDLGRSGDPGAPDPSDPQFDQLRRHLGALKETSDFFSCSGAEQQDPSDDRKQNEKPLKSTPAG